MMASKPVEEPVKGAVGAAAGGTGHIREWPGHRHWPWIMACGAVVLMLPALGAGLFMDDLVQRVIELKPEELPPQIQQTGFGSLKSGKLSTVVGELFGLSRRREALELAKDYGLLPWWLPGDVKAALWRPFTAFTHWIDYRLFPNTPWLMHAHNIAWFAGAVFLAAVLYRRIYEHACATNKPRAAGRLGIPGLAAGLFLLDKHSYFPVMFVANRGFIVALGFGLLCLYEHHKWRTTGSKLHMAGSALALGLSMLANEGGASTLAFLISYAVVFEACGWRSRIVSLLPAALVIATWRLVYVSLGFGVANLGGYIDPGYEPLLFMRQLWGRLITLWGGQLSGISPELVLVLNPSWRVLIATVFLVICLVCSWAFLPVLRADRAARFWFLSMVLALVPAATVVPLSKNMAFVAMGAFGVVAAFLADAFSGKTDPSANRLRRLIMCSIAGLLLIVHIPGALAARGVLAIATPRIPAMSKRACGFPRFPEIGGRDVVVINGPCPLTTMATPFVRAYYSEPVPASVRTLLPANTGFRLTRPSQRSLVAEADESTASRNLMGCDDLGAAHVGHALQAINNILPSKPTWGEGQHVLRKGFVTEVLETSPKGEPRRVAFHLEQDPESSQMVFLWFDWATLKYQHFAIPRVGGSVNIPGPHPRRDGGGSACLTRPTCLRVMGKSRPAGLPSPVGCPQRMTSGSQFRRYQRTICTASKSKPMRLSFSVG